MLAGVCSGSQYAQKVYPPPGTAAPPCGTGEFASTLSPDPTAHLHATALLFLASFVKDPDAITAKVLLQP